MVIIPEDITEFLYWVKERTEAYWSTVPITTAENEKCFHGAKWIGVEEGRIDEIEKRYGVGLRWIIGSF
jgi:hypothetical protein